MGNGLEIGHRRVVPIGLVVFGATSAACGQLLGLGVLIAARAGHISRPVAPGVSGRRSDRRRVVGRRPLADRAGWPPRGPSLGFDPLGIVLAVVTLGTVVFAVIDIGQRDG